MSKKFDLNPPQKTGEKVTHNYSVTPVARDNLARLAKRYNTNVSAMLNEILEKVIPEIEDEINRGRM